MMKLGYEFRQDGMFLVKQTCLRCSKLFEAVALENARSYCYECEAKARLELADLKLLEVRTHSSDLPSWADVAIFSAVAALLVALACFLVLWRSGAL